VALRQELRAAQAQLGQVWAQERKALAEASVDLRPIQEKLRALQERFQWKAGLVVKDWRAVVRVCNIDVSDLIGQTGTQAATAATAIIKLMARALYRIPNMAMGRPAFYMNRTVHSGLALAAMDKSQYVLKIEQGLTQFGTATSYLSFLGVPLRRVDSLLNSEARVV
jgi:hypothetical protein